MNFPALNPEDLGIIILVTVIALWALANKVLNNRRKVTRHVLHGQVTYTIQGYSGPEAVRLAKTLEKGDKIEEVEEVPGGISVTKATKEDVR